MAIVVWQRPSRRSLAAAPPRHSHRGHGVRALVLVAPLMCVLALASSAKATTAASADSSCTRPVDPYTESDAQVTSCGYQTYPRASTESLPDGGKKYDYNVGNSAISFTVPPASFDASTASSEELSEYGIPPEPPASSPEDAQWQQMVHNLHIVSPPEKLVMTGNQAEPVADTNNWSGYFNWNGGTNSYHHATAYYVEPIPGPTRCSNASVVMWAGLGGWYNANLAQDGTAINEPGYGNDQAWMEILPANQIALPLYATSGGEFQDDVQYTGNGNFTFWMYNFVTGQGIHATGTGGFDGDVSDFIVERPRVNGVLQNLLNFNQVTMQGYTNNLALNAHPYEKVYMTNPNDNNVLLAQPDELESSSQFTDYIYNCG